MPQPVDPPSSEEIEACVNAIQAVAEKDYDLHWSRHDLYSVRTQLMQLGDHAPLVIRTMAKLANDKAKRRDHRQDVTDRLVEPRVVMLSLLVGAVIYFLLNEYPFIAWPTALFVGLAPTLVMLTRVLRRNTTGAGSRSSEDS